MAHYNIWNELGEYVPATHPIADIYEQKARDFVSTPEDYAAVYADIPEEHRRPIVTPYGTVAAHAATYDPYSAGRKVSRDVDSDTTAPAPATYTLPSGAETFFNVETGRREEVKPTTFTTPVEKEGQQRVTDPHRNAFGTSGSLYTWIDGGWQYQGESNDPNLIGKEQFIKNYYEQKAAMEKQTVSDAVVAAVPPAAGFTPAAGTAAGFTSPTGLWGVPEPLPLLNMAPSYNPNLGLSSGYMPPTALWGNISMDALTQALTDITSGT